jgi:hypothetical protein
MAVDTRSKRASVLGVGTAPALTLPLSDGAVGQPDRQGVAFSYAGLAATEPPAITGQRPRPSQWRWAFRVTTKTRR